MKSIGAVSRQSGVSLRTLRYYDRIGLLHPSSVTPAGYRLYSEEDIARLGQILLWRELAFPLEEIKRMLEQPDFDRQQALTQQLELLRLNQERLQRLIDFARELQTTGVNEMDFSAFDTSKIDEYTAQAKARWGGTTAYKAYEEQHGGRGKVQEQVIAQGLMQQMAAFAPLTGLDPTSEQAQKQAEALRAYITRNYYPCTPEIFASLADMYDGGGEMTENIDAAGGKGTAAFAAKAVRAYCARVKE